MCTVCVCYKEDADTPTKEEYEVAKFLRFNIPSKEGKLMGMAVQYFLGKCYPTQVKDVAEHYSQGIYGCTMLSG